MVLVVARDHFGNVCGVFKTLIFLLLLLLKILQFFKRLELAQRNDGVMFALKVMLKLPSKT